ncbi:pyrokinin-1 receptor-like isoform X1 [Myzus persicae]|uniref:pyrokinin-1 receptor-like isoform X1 n=1 Tax=Myzus persicae TaxID=13164 RepID=UPI000B9314BD|nr:pyrokinin-1 receptor-like isoform X1 [Myzus persicae]
MLFEETLRNNTFYNDNISDGNNYSRHDDPWGPRRDPLPVVVPVTLVYTLIFATGIVGNVSTCIVIARNKYMHTATNYYLFSLAVSDLLLLLSGLPQEIYQTWSRYPYVFGEMFCIIRGFAAETSTNATVLTITAFTIERYVAICHPFISHTESNLPRAFKYILIIWVIALTLAFPQAIQMGLVYGREQDGTIIPELSTCGLANKLPYAFELSSVLFFLAPWTLIVVLYILIGLKLYKSKRDSSRTTCSAHCRHTACLSSTNTRATGRVVKMLVVVVVAFFVCWAPFQAQRLVAIYGDVNHEDHSSTSIIDANVYQVLNYVSGILYYLSATINPLLYNLMSYKFRTAFKETWRSCKGASGISPDHGMPALDYKWQRHHSHSRSFSSSHFDEVNSMKRLMANKSWQPTIVAINETSDTGTSSAVDKSRRFPRKMIFSKQDAIKENGTAMLENGITVGVLTNNNRTTTMLMTPN